MYYFPIKAQVFHTYKTTTRVTTLWSLKMMTLGGGWQHEADNHLQNTWSLYKAKAKNQSWTFVLIRNPAAF